MHPLLAYIDPGTGSMVLQIVLAAILSAGVVFRRVLFAPVVFLFARKGRTNQGETPPQTVEK